MPKAPWLKTAPKICAHTNCAVLRSSRPWRPWYYLTVHTVLHGVPINYLSWFCPTFWWGTHGGHFTDFTPPWEQFPHNYISSWDIFFFLRRNLHFILREMGFFVRIRRAKYSLGTQLLLLLKGSCFALKGCLLVSVSVCSFAQFSYSSLIFLYFNFWNISYIQYRGGNPLLFFKK